MSHYWNLFKQSTCQTSGSNHKNKKKEKISYKPGQCTSRSQPVSGACFSRSCQKTQAGTLVITLRALLTLTFGEPVGLADGERMAPFWMRSSLGGTGGRLRCCMQWPASPPWAFLCWLTGDELGDTMGEFWRSAQCCVGEQRGRVILPETPVE